MKYIWLNLNTGEFSNPFTKEDVDDYIDKEIMQVAASTNWKLIKFECVNDKEFEFYNRMKIVTNEK